MQGDLHDHESLVKAIKQVDVVISAVTFGQILDQSKILDAIKEAGNVKVRLYFPIFSNPLLNYFFWCALLSLMITEIHSLRVRK